MQNLFGKPNFGTNREPLRQIAVTETTLLSIVQVGGSSALALFYAERVAAGQVLRFASPDQAHSERTGADDARMDWSLLMIFLRSIC